MSTTTLTTKQISHAATNAASLTEHTFKLGDRVFPVVYLAYDDYIEFLTYLEPLLSALGTSAVEGFNPLALSSAILQYCKTSLPEMVHIMAKQTDPEITIDDVKKLVRNPFALAGAVLEQVKHDRMIEEISSFFAQIIGMMKSMTPDSDSKKTP